MEVINKTILKKRLFGQRIKKQIIEHVLLVIEEFKRFKRVDKRFLEAIESKYNYFAYHIKDDYRQEIVIRYRERSDEYYSIPEIRIHKYDGFNENRTPLTWDYLIEQLNKYGIDESIKEYEKKIENYDSDYQALMLFKERFEELEICNFGEPMRQIRNALQDVKAFAYRG